MKLGIPWRVKGFRPDTRETPWETARRARHVGERTVQYGDPRSRSDQLLAVHERINELTRQVERVQHAPAARPPYPPPAQGPEDHALPSYHHNRDHHLAEAILRLERRMDELVNANRDIPALPSYAEPVDAPPAPADMPEPVAFAQPDTPILDLDQAMAETITQALDAELNAAAFAPPRATAEVTAPVEPEASAQTAPVPAQNLSGLEQHLRDITSQIEALRPPPQAGEVPAPASALDNSRPAGGDTDTPAPIERGLAELFETLCSAFSKHNAAVSFNELAGQTAIFIAACPVPGAATAHRGSPLNAGQTNST
jgi:localization factor PodJL